MKVRGTALKRILAASLALCLLFLPCALAQRESAATLCVAAYGEKRGEYPLACASELSAETLLAGLSALTEHNFACERAEIGENGVVIVWADEATFLRPETAPMRVERLDLTFYDLNSTLQFMLDSAYWTLRENLGVENVFFETPSGAGLRLAAVPNWNLPAGVAYNGDFAAWYVDGFAFEDARTILGDAGENIAAPDAAQVAYAYLIAGTDADDGNVRIVLTHIGDANGSEGYGFSILAGEESLRALVTYDGGVYLEADGAFVLAANWK